MNHLNLRICEIKKKNKKNYFLFAHPPIFHEDILLQKIEKYFNHFSNGKKF